MELIPLTFHKIMQSHSYTVIIFGTDTKKFAIYTDPSVGKIIQHYLAEEPQTRPYTHDLLNAILKGFELNPLQITINNVEDTIYFARLFLQKEIGEERHIVEIDVRPSDAVILALTNHTPIYCRKEVLEKTVAIED